MEYIAIYRDKHYLVKESSQIKATLQAFELAQKDFGIESADFSEFTIIEPKEFITIYGEELNLANNTITYNGETYPLDDPEYKQKIEPFLEKQGKAKTIYYYNGKRYEITKD